MKTTTTVWISRRVGNMGISAQGVFPFRFADGCGDTLGKLPVGDPLQTLQGSVYPAYEGFCQRLARPHRGDEGRAGEQIGDGVLAQISEGEAERARVSPGEPALDLAHFRERERRLQRGGKVERG